MQGKRGWLKDSEYILQKILDLRALNALARRSRKFDPVRKNLLSCLAVGFHAIYTGCRVRVLRSLNCNDGDFHVMWIILLRTDGTPCIYILLCTLHIVSNFLALSETVSFLTHLLPLMVHFSLSPYEVVGKFSICLALCKFVKNLSHKKKNWIHYVLLSSTYW